MTSDLLEVVLENLLVFGELGHADKVQLFLSVGRRRKNLCEVLRKELEHHITSAQCPGNGFLEITSRLQDLGEAVVLLF